MDVTVVGKEVIDLPKDETPSSGDYFLAQDENGGSKAIDYANLEDSIVGSVATREFEFSTREKSTLIDAIEDIDGSIGEIPEIKQSVSSVAGNVAEEFSVSKAYAVGDYVLRDGQLYCFTTAHPAGAWNAAHVQVATVADAVSALKGDLSDRIDDLEDEIDDLKYVPISINSFSLSPATVEKGSTVQTLNFSYSFNKTPTTLKLGTENLTPSGTSTQKTELSVTSDTTYTLTATDSGSYSNPAASASKTATLHFYDKIHYGVAEVPSAYNDSFLLTGLSNHDLASGKGKIFTVNATSGKYIFFALPTAMGTPNFNVGGFDGGFTKAAEFSHTNASGYATTYAVYKSDNAGLGSTKVTVS